MFSDRKYSEEHTHNIELKVKELQEQLTEMDFDKKVEELNKEFASNDKEFWTFFVHTYIGTKEQNARYN